MPFGTNSPKEGAMWHTDPLLSSDYKQRPLVMAVTYTYETIVERCSLWSTPRPFFGKHVSAAADDDASIEERCFPCGLCREVINQDSWSNEFDCGIFAGR
jgi:hypothetical protein